MKMQQLFFLLICCLMMPNNYMLYTQTSETKVKKVKSHTPKQKNNADNQMPLQTAESAALLFPQELPTSSINEELIEQLYGLQALAFPADVVTHIKQAYCYFEFLIKLDRVQNDKKFAEFAVDFKDFIQVTSDNKALLPTQQLVTSKGWNSIPVTSQDYIASSAWQNFLKAMICDSSDSDAEYIVDATEVNNQMFPYLANIETAYSTNNFNQMRVYQESIQLDAFLRSIQRKRYLAQCIDWKNKSKSELMKNIAEFKKTDFYIYSHTVQPNVADTKTGKSTSIPSPIPEQIVLYAMFTQLQIVVYDSITQSTLPTLLAQHSSVALEPNFFVYNMTDFVYLQDFLTLQTLYSAVKTSTKKDLIPMNQTPEGGSALLKKQAQSAVKNQANKTTPQPASAQDYDLYELQARAAVVAFKDLPVASSYEQVIDEIYGFAGLNIPQEQLIYIKKTYCYIEFLVKLDKVKKDPKYGPYQTDFKQFLVPDKDGKALHPTQELVQSAGWKAIPITDQDIMKSSVWQNYIKAMICDCYDRNRTFILNNAQAQQDVLGDLPDNDAEYFSADNTQPRLYLESLQLDQYIQNQRLQRYLEQCPDWQTLNTKQLRIAIAIFKNSEFYDLTHNPTLPQSLSVKKNPYTSMNDETKNQIVGYYFLLTIGNNTIELLKTDTLSSFLNKASSSKLSPNFFIHTPADFIYLYDFLILQNLIDQNIEDLQNSADDAEPDDTAAANTDDDNSPQTQDDVTIQSLKKVNRAFRKAFDPKKNGLTASVKKTNRQVTRQRHKQNRINKRNSRRDAKFWKKNKVIILTAVILTVVIIACIVVIVLTAGVAAPAVAGGGVAGGGALGGGAAAGGAAAGGAAVAAPTFLGSTTLGAMAASASAGVGAVNTAVATGGLVAGAQLVGSSAVGALAAAVLPTVSTVGALYATSVVAGVAVGIAAGTDKNFREDLMANVMMPIMIGMEKMTEAFTDGFIEFSVGLTWYGCALGQDLGFKTNPRLEASKVRAKMNAHKSSINIAMSIVVTILITVAIIMISSYVGTMYASYLNGAAKTAEAAALTAEINANAAAMMTIGIADDVTFSTVVASNNLYTTATAARTAATAARTAATAARSGAAATTTVGAADQVALKQGVTTGVKQSAITSTEQVAVKQGTTTAAQQGTSFSSRVGSGIRSTLKPKQTRLAAQRNALTTSEELTKKQLAETAAKNSFDDVMRSTSATSAERENARAVVHNAILEREAAEQSANKATQVIAKQRVSPAQKAADRAKAQLALKQEAEASVKVSVQNGTLGDDALVAAQQETKAAKIAADAANKEVTRLGARTSFQAAVDARLAGDSVLKSFGAGLKQGLYTYTFVIGQLANAGFTSLSIIGAAVQDMVTADRQNKEADAIQDLWKFVEHSKVSMSLDQNVFMDELHKKQQIAVENQALGLHYYKNFLNSSLDTLQTQISQILAQQQVQLLTPDTDGLLPADIGSAWGLQTKFLYLYPSQGFITTTLGRPDFPYAQEVAQSPLTFASNQQAQVSLSNTGKASPEKLWFKQRAITIVDQKANDPLRVEIKFRIIYSLNTAYHVGLYCGGKYQDHRSAEYLQHLQETAMIDLNEAHLAKMLVIKREDSKSKPRIGLYEHEGKGWIIDKPISDIAIDNASVYHMSAQLDNNTVTISFWSEDNPSKKITQTATVTPCDQRTFGVIFSGVAVEWGVVTPTLPIVENQNARAQSNGDTEVSREQSSKAQWQQILNPTFANMQLTAIDKTTMLQGNYLYTTTDTKLVDTQGNALPDVVVLAIASGSGIENIGMNPVSADQTQQPNAFISFITNNVYDATGSVIAQNPNTWQTYQQKTANIGTDIKAYITKAIGLYGKAPQNKSVMQTTISQNNSINTLPVTGGVQIGLSSQAPAALVSTTQSISQLQISAAGTASIEYGSGGLAL